MVYMDNKKTPITTYHEKVIGKTLYRVTCVHKGEIELNKAIEGLIIRKIIRDENTPSKTYDIQKT
jgi:hypothetical protein